MEVKKFRRRKIQSFEFLLSFAWHLQGTNEFHFTWHEQESMRTTKSNLCCVLWIKAYNYLSYRFQRKSIRFLAFKFLGILAKWLLNELQIANVNSFCTLKLSFLCFSHSMLLLFHFTTYPAWLQLKALRMEYYHLHSLVSMISHRDSKAVKDLPKTEAWRKFSPEWKWWAMKIAIITTRDTRRGNKTSFDM